MFFRKNVIFNSIGVCFNILFYRYFFNDISNFYNIIPFGKIYAVFSFT